MASLLALGVALLTWLFTVQQARDESMVLWLTTGLAYVLTCFGIWRWQRSLPTGWLVWTGVVWRLQPPGEILPTDSNASSFARCESVLDLQSAFLLRLHAVVQAEGTEANKRSVWVWAHKTAHPQNWHALRVAVIWAQQAQNAPEPVIQAGKRA